MDSLGGKLKEARLKQGLSLNEIAGKTRIQTHFLEAIEQDNLAKIPGDFFRKSFVRQYASTLGLDPDEFETTTEIQFGSFGAAGAPLQGSLSLPEQPDLPPLPTPGSKGHFPFRQVLLSVGLLVGVIAVCAVAYMLWEDFQTRERNASTSPEPVIESTPTPVSQNAPDTSGSVVEAEGETSSTTVGPVGAQPPTTDTAPTDARFTSSPIAPGSRGETAPAAASSTAPDEAAQTATVHGSGDREIRLSANALTWVRVRDGEKTVYVGTIDAGQSRVIRVSDTAQILTGNAGGLSVVWQGNDVGRIGPAGQVRTVTLTPAGASIQAPAPKSPPDGREGATSPGVER